METMVQNVRVFLLDDHEVVRRGLSELLSTEDGIEVVGDSGSAPEATRRIPALRPDVAVLDARLPDGNGIDVCREIRSVDPTIKVIILTSYDDEEALLSAILAGASGYVLKEVRGAALVDGIRRVARGESLLQADDVERVLKRLQAGPRDIEELRRLTEQEHRILELIAQGMTNRQIAEAMKLAEKTVKNYVSNVLSKLGMQSRTQAALFASRLLAVNPHR
ncbi:response regulator transcription factor [Sporichthya sp.]|uniref:response regulator n=1 Tax=Sporichthya sp. TaxID=65475 RepID=UPI0025EC8355|nr:response regulator transcription factor [Sporichthya sp.]